MTVPSLFEASYKRLKFTKVNNGTKPTASPFPRIPPSGITLPQLGRDSRAEPVQTSHHPAELGSAEKWKLLSLHMHKLICRKAVLHF